MKIASALSRAARQPWNKGKVIRQKPPLNLRETRRIRTRFSVAAKARELALFNLPIDNKLRGCDLVTLRVCNVAPGNHVVSWACVIQHKTREPVRFESTEQTHAAVLA